MYFLICISRLQHIAYGRISGMSTRKGTVVLLQDILNEAKQLAIESTRNTKSKKNKNKFKSKNVMSDIN